MTWRGFNKLDPLAEMHLLLREHGWEPELETQNGPAYWVWMRPELGGQKGPVIFTWPQTEDFNGADGRCAPGQLWSEYFTDQAANQRMHYSRRCGLPEPTKYFSVDGLRRRLDELEASGPITTPAEGATLDSLAKMHLLLLEHSWVPEPGPRYSFRNMWFWTKPDMKPVEFITHRCAFPKETLGSYWRWRVEKADFDIDGTCMELGRLARDRHRHTIASLQRRLEELGRQEGES